MTKFIFSQYHFINRTYKSVDFNLHCMEIVYYDDIDMYLHTCFTWWFAVLWFRHVTIHLFYVVISWWLYSLRNANSRITNIQMIPSCFIETTNFSFHFHSKKETTHEKLSLFLLFSFKSNARETWCAILVSLSWHLSSQNRCASSRSVYLSRRLDSYLDKFVITHHL